VIEQYLLIVLGVTQERFKCLKGVELQGITLQIVQESLGNGNRNDKDGAGKWVTEKAIIPPYAR